MTEKTPEQKEIDALREHNAELLADLRKARKKLAELTEQAEALTAERDAAHVEVRRIKLERPVQAMLERVALLPEHFLSEFNARGYRFELEGDDVVIRDSDGNPALLGEAKRGPHGSEVQMREAQFTEDDIRALVWEEWLPEEQRSPRVANFHKLVIGSRATGGGAPGSRRAGHWPPAVPTPKAEPERLPTGLR